METLRILREKVFAQSNEACFVERETFLHKQPNVTEKPYHYYANLLAALLDAVSVPVDPADVIVGRVVEGPPVAARLNNLLWTLGHMTPDYHRLLTLGYSGILREIQENATRLGTEEARQYAENAETVVLAIRRFALRYAEAAKAMGNEQAYEALLRVPYEPAYDTFSALQSVWLVHMIASCYVGERDYAFGYMDEWLYPYYKADKEKGVSDSTIQFILAGFLMKPNEICGRGTYNYKQKPVPCQASKQYLLLDGGYANELSVLILEAAKLNCMAPPEFTVLLADHKNSRFKKAVTGAMAVLTDKLQVYRYETLRDFLQDRGLPEDIAARPAFSACCTFDLNWHSFREEYYLPTVQIFCQVLQEKTYDSLDEIKEAFLNAVRISAETWLDNHRNYSEDQMRRCFVLDALLLGECNDNCAYPPHGMRWRVKNIFLPGIATLGDSMYALRKYVFEEKRMSYADFAAMLHCDFAGKETVRAELLALPKFGNDSDADSDTADMGHLLCDAVQSARHEANEILVPSFYSLQRENTWTVPATPDGRRSGTAFSENQSPTYGADKEGITALLNSVAKLPFAKTAAGGLNLMFSFAVTGEILEALLDSYFANGGLHMGISVANRETLEDAMAHPDKYKSLTVRLYGFSEYFISLPEWQQIAVLNRTAY